MDQGALDKVVKELKDVLRKSNKELAETKGDIHEYLGLTIDFGEKGHIIFTMYNYIEDIIGTAPLDMNKTAPGLVCLWLTRHHHNQVSLKLSSFIA